MDNHEKEAADKKIKEEREKTEAAAKAKIDAEKKPA